MAPLITITIKGLLASVGFKQPQTPFHATAQVPIQAPSTAPATHKHCDTPLKALGSSTGTFSLSAVSWAIGRTDIFGQAPSTGVISHKWWDGHQWNPEGNTLEQLGKGAEAAPVTVSVNTSRVDIFSSDGDGNLLHQYYDGTDWKPSATTLEPLGGGLHTTLTQLAATTWGQGRLDIFGIGQSDSALLHKYYDGSQWNPSEDLENLGGDLSAGVTAVSWGPNRLDIFAIDKQKQVVHIYYDGSQWSSWEDLAAPVLLSAPTVSSWGPNRLDLFGVDEEKGALWHTAWDGSRWLPWENLGGNKLVGPVAAVNWSVNRTDIVALGSDNQYYYKYWDGHQWNPTDNTLFPKGGQFSSLPTLSSWGPDRLDIWGITNNSQLGHQTWYGSGWYPEFGFETLGGDLEATMRSQQKTHQKTHQGL